MKTLSLLFVFGLISCMSNDLSSTQNYTSARDSVIASLKRTFLPFEEKPANLEGIATMSDVVEAELEINYIPVDSLEKELNALHYSKDVKDYIEIGKIAGRSFSSSITLINDVAERVHLAAGTFTNGGVEFVIYGLLHGKTKVSFKQQYQTLTKKVCEKPWYCVIFCEEECHNKTYTEPREINDDERRQVKEAARIKIDAQLKKKLEKY